MKEVLKALKAERKKAMRNVKQIDMAIARLGGKKPARRAGGRKKKTDKTEDKDVRQAPKRSPKKRADKPKPVESANA